MNTSTAKHNYAPDILGAGYEQLTLNFPDDYEGKVVATLVRKKSHSTNSKSGTLYSWFFRLFLSNRNGRAI